MNNATDVMEIVKGQKTPVRDGFRGKTGCPVRYVETKHLEHKVDVTIAGTSSKE
jgi:hypothetical protein